MSNRLVLTTFLALLLVGLIALLITGAAREAVVIPLLYMFWLARVLIASVPQLAWWFGFLAIAALLAWKSLAGARTPPAAAARPIPPDVVAPVAGWARLFEGAERDHYARWLLAQRLAPLALDLLAQQGRQPLEHPWRYLQDEASDIPPAIRAYLLAGRQEYRAPPRLRRLWPFAALPAARADPLDIDPAEVIRFIEIRSNSAIGDTL